MSCRRSRPWSDAGRPTDDARSFHEQHKPAFSIYVGCVRLVIYSVMMSLIQLVVALVFSRLDYCNAVLAGLTATTLAPLQRVIHASARLVFGLRPRDHVTSALRALHWLPIAQRIKYKLCPACLQVDRRSSASVYEKPPDCRRRCSIGVSAS